MFIGHTRFSLFQPGSTRWRASEDGRFQGEDDYRRYLFSSERLEVRVKIFLEMTIPQLAVAATGHMVRHIISYSSRLPDKYKRQLTQAADTYPFLVLDECQDSATPLTPETYVRSMLSQERSSIFAEYRLDDDDVLAHDYYDQLAPYLNSPFVGMYVSLGEGLTAIYREGHFYDVRRCHSPMLAIGLAKICRFNENGTLEAPPTTRHTVADTVAPVILDSRKLGFIWTRHPDQDTAVTAAKNHTRDELFERARHQIARYPLENDMGQVRRQFPVMSDLIHTHAGPDQRQFSLIHARTRVAAEGVNVKIPRLQERCTFTIKVRSSTSLPGRDMLVAFDFEDQEGDPISAPHYEETMKERGVILSSRKKFGFCRFIATRPGLRKDEFVLDLPDGVSLAGLTLYPRHGVSARLEVEQFVVENGRALTNEG